jgi:hypothetical protein
LALNVLADLEDNIALSATPDRSDQRQDSDDEE